MRNKLLSLFLFSLMLSMLVISCEKDENETPPASVVAKFSFTSDNNFLAPSKITFVDESVVPTTAGTATYAWDFGDNTTSAEKAPVHTYAESGTYTVKLKITSTKADPVEFSASITIQKGTLFSEDFESFQDEDYLPVSWIVVDGDKGTPDDTFYDKAWRVAKSSKMGGKVAVATSYYVTPVDADDWMILPAIKIETSTFLSWAAMSLTSSGNYPDSYEVYVSTTTQDVAGCTAATGKMIKQVVDESWATTATSKPGAGVKNHEVDLSEFAGKNVYIAFRLMTSADAGSELGIDNIKVFRK